MFRKIAILFVVFLLLLGGEFVYAKDVYTLNRAVKEAISNSYIVKEAIQNQRAAIEKYKSSKANMLPKMSFAYNYTRLKDYPYSLAGPMRMKVGNRNNVDWNVMITQPIFTGFALTTQKEMAKLGINVRRIQRRQAILDIAENVKKAYFNILLAKKYLKVANEEVKNLKAHESDAEKFYKSGIIAYNDLLKSKVALANAVQNRVNMKNNLKLAISSFNIALRKNINADTDVVDVLSFKKRTFSLDNLINTAIRKRPAIRELNIKLRQSYLGVKLAKSSYYPDVSTFAEYEQTGKDVLADDNDFSNNHNLMFGVRVQWKLFEFGKRHFDVEEQYHKTFALQNKIDSIKDSVKLEVERALLDLNSSKQNIQTAKQALKQAEENYRITSLRYEQQLTTSTEVLDADSYLTQAQTNYYNALYGYNIALAKLKRAIGER